MSTGSDDAREASTAPSAADSKGAQPDAPADARPGAPTRAEPPTETDAAAPAETDASAPAEAPKRKPQPTARERAERKREEKLENVREEVKAGSLVIRQMTDEERARYPRRENAPRSKRFGGR
jgi:hypothetical protein